MTRIVFHEIAWLLLGGAAVGLLGATLRQPVMVSFIAGGIVAGALFVSSAETAKQIRFLRQLVVALLWILARLKLGARLVRTLGSVAFAAEFGR